MTDLLRYRMGGFSLAVRSREAPLAEESAPEYLPFVESVAGEPDITVELSVGTPSLPPGSRLLLDAGGAWSAHAHGDELLIAPVAPPPGVPDWLAAVGADRRRWRIGCAASLLTRAGSERRLVSPVHYPLDQILLSLALAGEGLIVHAAAVEVNGRGVLLPGVSGAGKTTLSSLCAQSGLAVLSDDRAIVRRSGGVWRIYGTPWPGEGGFAQRGGVPLTAVVFPVQGQENRLCPLAPAAFARRLVRLASIPWYDRRAAEQCLDVISALAVGIRLSELTFLPERGAVEALIGVRG